MRKRRLFASSADRFLVLVSFLSDHQARIQLHTLYVSISVKEVLTV